MNIEKHGGRLGWNLPFKTLRRAAVVSLIGCRASVPVLLGSLCALTAHSNSAAASTLPSSSGTEMPPAREIVDSSGDTWTFLAKGDIAKNGVRDRSSWNVSSLLFFRGVLYQENTSHEWYAHKAGYWTYEAGGDPENPPTLSSSGVPRPLPVPTPVPVVRLPQKPITNWVKCDGSDQYAGVVAAFAAAKNNAFNLTVNCPVTIHIGTQTGRTVFIDNGTTVTFTAGGRFILDNVEQPAFAIFNSSNINLFGWNILYTGITPVTPPVGAGSHTWWSDTVATQWLAANRGIKFAPTQDDHVVTGFSLFDGLVNTSALIYIKGGDANITVKGFTATAASVKEGYRFIPCVFAISPNWSDNQTLPVIPRNTPAPAQLTSGPTNLKFEDITLDGTLMGFTGGGINGATFDNIKSYHYGDLQDANGENVGGIGKWFSPPHLFYIAEPNSTNMRFTNIVDAPDPISSDNNGDRAGVARDASTVHQSGVTYSLKLGCSGCVVNGYVTNRPDGFMDVRYADGVTIENVTATYNSKFTSGLYSAIRFPGPYTGLIFKNVTLTDVAGEAMVTPIGGSGEWSGLRFENVNVYVNSVSRGVALVDENAGQEAGSLRNYHLAYQGSDIAAGPSGTVQ